MQANEVGKIYERPWGSYRTLELGATYQVKIITVNPGGKLSLQKHMHRSEHWIVVQGTPTFTIDNQKANYPIDHHVSIKKEQIHRMENNTDQPCIIIEVQLGDYLGEDDIIRLQDIYNR